MTFLSMILGLLIATLFMMISGWAIDARSIQAARSFRRDHDVPTGRKVRPTLAMTRWEDSPW